MSEVFRGETMMKPTKNRCAATSALLTAFLLLTVVVPLAPTRAQAQQHDVSRFDVFGGYTFLDSPHVKLFESGVHFQVGYRPKTWYSLGIDYSATTGNMTLSPTLLTTSLQQQLGQLIPPSVAATLTIPANSHTQTFAGGPQLAYRHFTKITLFVRPSVGAIHERAIGKPTDALQAAAVNYLVPGGVKTDWALFYGGGGGVDFLLSKHFALRVQADLVYDHLFSDLLQDGRFTTRFSIGPCFNLGKNIAK